KKEKQIFSVAEQQPSKLKKLRGNNKGVIANC
ncbi:MAG: hypothetical protein ACI945_000518, partial [Pseudohongiellaceae bacterium]